MIGTYFIYNSILIFSTLFVWLSEKAKNGNSRFILLSIAFLIIFIPAAIRYNIGTDYWAYIEIFYNLIDGKDSHTEYGYQFLNHLVASMGLSAEWLVVLVSFITYLYIFKAYPKSNAWIMNFLYITTIYLYTYSNFRTGIVLALMLYATMNYIERKNIISFIAYVVIASLLHKTAILYLIIPIFYSKFFIKIFSSKTVLFLLIFILIAIYIIRYDFIMFMLSNPIFELLGYSYYLNSKIFFNNTELSSGLGVIARAFPLILFIFFSLNQLKSNIKLVFGVSMSFLYLLLIILAITIEIFLRVEMLFVIIYIILGYLSIVYFTNLKKILYLISIVFIWTLLYFKNIDSAKSDMCAGVRIAPYVSIFNKEDDKSLGIPRTICEKW